ncbi:MAG: hypothetical protein K6C94_04285 [Candidatus Gastranaerophilales bacterium]|nr:hypothetical protein [Candidatus Gastranaerophilales bacterium]
MQILYDNTALIYLLPLIAFLLAIFAKFFKYSVSEKSVAVVSISANALSLAFVSALIFYLFFGDFEPFSFDFIWLKTTDLTVSMGCLIDKFSVCALFVVLLTALTVQIASYKFFQDNDKFLTYFGRFNLLLFLITAFVLSSNLVQSVILAAVTGASAFLLLNLNSEKYNVMRYSRRFLIIDRIGDFCLITALFIIFYFINTYELTFEGSLLSFNNFNDIVADLYVYISDENFYILCLMIFTGICAKSGIFPFHSKPAVALYDYSPAFYFLFISLSISGSLLVIRLLPMFDLSEKIIYTILIWFALIVLYSLVYEIINRFYLHKNDNSYIVYSCLTALYVILPLTMTSKTGIFKSDLMLYMPFIFFAVLYVFWFISGEKFYCRTQTVKNISDSADIVTRFGCFAAEQVTDFLCNITRLTDKYLIPAAANIVGYCCRVKSWLISFSQNGKIRNYLIYSLIFISVMLLLYLFILLEAENINV